MSSVATTRIIRLPDLWKIQLSSEFESAYFTDLRNFLKQQYQLGTVIYPDRKNIFRAFELTNFDQVKVVILGQDPYHGPGQAHGLSFSVPKEVALPPSLLNIYKELQADLNIVPSKNGCLTHWAEQGVLLLNSVLTVTHQQPASHQGKGWELFTDAVIRALNARENPVIFVLWGSYAQKKGQWINPKKHYVLKSVHPSPLSAYRGFFGSRPFSKINRKLKEWHLEAIQW